MNHNQPSDEGAQASVLLLPVPSPDEMGGLHQIADGKEELPDEIELWWWQKQPKCLVYPLDREKKTEKKRLDGGIGSTKVWKYAKEEVNKELKS